MKKPYLIAGAIVVLTTAWLASGMIDSDQQASDEEESMQISGPQMIVEADYLDSSEVTPFIIAHGNLQPNRSVVLKNEASGQVEKLLVKEGDAVKAGQALIQLDLDDREIRREQAELRISERRSRFEAIQSLAERNLASTNEANTAEVDLKMAEVELAQVELEIENTTVRAPFDGILEELDVEIGEYLGVGQEVLTLVDNSPLVVNVRVPQQNVNVLSTGKTVRVTLLDNQEAEGVIRYIASRSDEATRTFRVEIEIPNDGELRAGTTATAYIPRPAVAAHFISGGLLTLDSDGQMGVKTVTESGVVSFNPVAVEYSESGGMWVSGLPARALVITSGQGFADDGQEVIISNMPDASQERVQPMPAGGTNAHVN